MIRSADVSAVLGQLAQAAVNFLVLFGAARGLAPADFAWVSVYWIVFVVLLNAQRVLVLEQLLVRRPVALTAIAWTSGLVSGLLCASAGAVILMVVGVQDATVYFVLLSALLLVSDAGRYVCIEGGHSRRLLTADGVCLALIGIGFALQVLTADALPLLTFVGAGSGASIVLLWSDGAVSVNLLRAFLAELGSYAAYALVQVILVNLAAQALILVSLFYLAPSQFAQLRAVQALASPLTTPILAVQAVLVGRFARSHKAGLRHWLSGYVMWAGCCIAGAALLGYALAASAGLWSPVLLSTDYSRIGALVLPVVLAMGLVYAGVPGGVHLRVLALGRAGVSAQLVSIAAGALAMLGLTPAMGPAGAAWAVAIQALVSVLAGYIFLFASLRARAGTPPTISPSATSERTSE